MKASRFFVTVGIGVILTSQGYAFVHECPPGQVWGGQKCEWRDLCPDGQPANNGECDRAQATPLSIATPAPPSLAEPEPLRCPDGSVASRNGCQPVAVPCPPGKISANGRCSFQIRSCDRNTVFSRQESSGRSVIFVNGDLAGLFNRYSSDAQRSRLELDLDHLKVIFFDSENKRVVLEGGNNVKMDIGQLFAGMTMKQVWLRKLKKYKIAFDLSDPVTEAGQFGGDLLCGPRE